MKVGSVESMQKDGAGGREEGRYRQSFFRFMNSMMFLKSFETLTEINFHCRYYIYIFYTFFFF